MRDVLVVVDMQNDFIDGALGTAEAVRIVPDVEAFCRDFSGEIIFTRDTHFENYASTQEGTKIPVPHCIRGSEGWQLSSGLLEIAEKRQALIIDKPTFGSAELGARLADMDREEKISEIILVGVCTDICVISNAMLVKAFLPEVPVSVISSLCAGVSVESHNRALEAMKVCQINIKK